MSERAVEAIARILGETEDADDVLRRAVAVLATEPEIVRSEVSFFDEGSLALGPQAGEPDETRRMRVAVTFQDALVGEL